MPTWETSPPESDRGPALDIKRVPPGRPFVCAILNEDLVGCRTHFWGGRTVPCETPNCKPCNEGVPWRWHAYIGCIEATGKPPFILELTAHAAQRLIEYRSANGTLRGCRLRAMRANFAKNSRLTIETSTLDLTQHHLPQPPNLINALSILWSLPLPAIQPTGSGGLADSHETLSDVADRSRCMPIGMACEELTSSINLRGGNGQRPGAS